MKDNRGFETYSDQTDSYGANVRVKMSSAVDKHCWIFIQGGQITDNKGSAHLTPGQAKRVITALQKFLADY